MNPRPHSASEPAANPHLTSSGGDTHPRTAADARPALSPPRRPGDLGTLGRYRVLAELGRGGMGVVFRAEDPLLRRTIALKVMLPAAAADPRAKARFLREARAQAAVEHENVAVIHEVGEADGVPFIAMPLLRGQMLAAALKRNPRPPLAEVVRVGREIADGLAAAHERGLIHRDIKPANVWLEGRRRRVRILDFGLARPEAAADDAPRPAPAASASDALLTSSSAVAGTPAYMSPEQVKGGPLDHRSDLWSLGVVLYQMATGALPFAGATAIEVLFAVTEHTPPAAHQVSPDVPLPLSELIWRLMLKNPADRPQTAAAVSAELEALEGSLSLARLPAVPLSGVLPETGPDPWAELTVSNGPTPAEDAPEDDDETEYVAPAARGRAGVPRWVWAVAGAGVLCAVGVGVWLAAPKRKPVVTAPPPDTTQAPRAVPPVGPAPANVKGAERVAAEALNPLAALVLRPEFGPPVRVEAGSPLPRGEFTVTEVWFAAGGKVADATVEGTVFPALLALRSLEVLYGWNAVFLSDAQLERLSKLPFAPSLRSLCVSFDLNPRTFEALKRFPLLTAVQCHAAETDDALLGRLVQQFPTATSVILDFKKGTKVTPRGLDVLAALPLETLGVAHTPALDAEFLKRLPGNAKLRELMLWGTPVADADVKELQKCEGLRFLILSGTRVTDAGLEHLEEMPALHTLHLNDTKVTVQGVEKLAKALPRCRIVYPGGATEPKSVDEILRASVAALLKAGAKVVVDDESEGGYLLKDVRDLKAGGRIHRVGVGPSASLADPAVIAALRAFPVEGWHAPRAQLVLGGPVTPEQFRSLVRLPSLRPLVSVWFDAADLPDAELAHLAHLPRLTGVVIHKSPKLTEAVVTRLVALPGLRTLNLSAVSFEPAVLRPLRDSSVAALTMTGLAHIDDDAVEHLAALSNLKYLWLDGTKVTKAGVEKLATALPRCRITWDGGTTEPKPAAEIERKAAEALNPHFQLKLKLAGGGEVTVNRGDKLPAEAFAVTYIGELDRRIPDDVATDVLLPAVAQLGQLREIYGWNALYFGPGQVDRLARSPAADTLASLTLATELTPAVLDSLKRFPKLTWVQFYARAADDPLLERLARDFPQLTGVQLDLDGNPKVTARGLAALTALPLGSLGVNGPAVDAAFLRRLAGVPTLWGASFWNAPLGDDDVKELARYPGLSQLVLNGTRVTDAGLKHLEGVTSLTLVSLHGTKVTDAGVRALAKARPRCQIEWNGGTIEPGK
jgi:serine/threonine protein kinase